MPPDSPLNAATSQPGWPDDPVGRLALWMDQRLPLPQMLRTLAEEHGGRAAPALRAMADRVESGEELSGAFAATKSQLPRGLRDQLAVAAESGNLRAAIPAAASQRAAARNMAAESLAILAYPLVVLVALTLILLLFSLYIVPQFGSIFNDFGLTLPPVTLAVLSFSVVFPPAALGVMVLLAAVALLWRAPYAARPLHWLATSPPLFGRLWVCHGHHSFTQLMSAFTAAGMPSADALRATAAGLTDQNLANAARQVAQKCEEGRGMAEAMAQSRHFERPLTAVVGWGENNGDLPSALAEASASYQAQAQNLLTLVRRVAPPVMFACVAATVFGLVASLFLPLVSLIQNLSG